MHVCMCVCVRACVCMYVLHKQSLIFLGTTVLPRENKVQGLWKNFGGQTRRVMGDGQMADEE